MLTLDTNATHGIALVCDDDSLNGCRYVPIAEASAMPACFDVQEVYLRQAHFVARTTAVGLTANTRPMLTGWHFADKMMTGASGKFQ